MHEDEDRRQDNRRLADRRRSDRRQNERRRGERRQNERRQDSRRTRERRSLTDIMESPGLKVLTPEEVESLWKHIVEYLEQAEAG